MELVKLQQNAKLASQLLKAMSNEHRLLILCELLDRERSVGQLVRAVGVSQSALSQHLARLRRDRVVRTRRDAQVIWYSLASAEVRTLLVTLEELFGPERTAPGERRSGRGYGHAARP